MPITHPNIFSHNRPLQDAIDDLRDVAALMHRRGFSLGTSSNYSILLSREPFELLVTASGKAKRRLKKTHIVVVDEVGKNLAAAHNEQSAAEPALHVMLAQRPGIGSVLHTHSVWGTLLSDLHGDSSGFWIVG